MSRCASLMVNTFSGASNRRPQSDVSTWAPGIVFGHTEMVTVCGRSVTCGEHEQSTQSKQEAQAAANNLEIGFAALAASVESDSPSSLADGPIRTLYSRRHCDTQTCAQIRTKSWETAFASM